MRLAPLAIVPKGLLGLAKEVGRHLLRRPVVGVAAAAHTEDGRWLFIRRGDTGTWAMAGGTLEWGETMLDALRRELEEEAGVVGFSFERVVGVYSRPDRDPRFHGVTVVVLCAVAPPTQPPMNPLEIREVGLFAPGDVPRPLALSMDDMFDDALAGRPCGIE